MPKTNRDNNYSKEHSQQRFFERYGKIINDKEYELMVNSVRKMIDNNINIRSKNKASKTNTQYVIQTKIENQDILAVFETERNTITTFLPIKNH